MCYSFISYIWGPRHYSNDKLLGWSPGMRWSAMRCVSELTGRHYCGLSAVNLAVGVVTECTRHRAGGAWGHGCGQWAVPTGQPRVLCTWGNRRSGRKMMSGQHKRSVLCGKRHCQDGGHTSQRETTNIVLTAPVATRMLQAIHTNHPPLARRRWKGAGSFPVLKVSCRPSVWAGEGMMDRYRRRCRLSSKPANREADSPASSPSRSFARVDH